MSINQKEYNLIISSSLADSGITDEGASLAQHLVDVWVDTAGKDDLYQIGESAKSLCMGLTLTEAEPPYIRL